MCGFCLSTSNLVFAQVAVFTKGAEQRHSTHIYPIVGQRGIT